MTPEPVVRPAGDGVVTIRAPEPGDAAVLIGGRDEIFHRFLGPGDEDPRPAACIEAGGAVVGWVDYDTGQRWLGPGEVNIGYNVLPAYRGKGYARRGVVLLLEQLSRHTTHHTATVTIDPANAASLAVARRAGFVPAGEVDGSLFLMRPVHLPHCERPFEDLVAEGVAEPVEGWDFSWFRGRATEARPSWGYAGSLASRLASTDSVLDVQTGGGEVFAEALVKAGAPPVAAATESWPPNLVLARERLAPFAVTVVEVSDDAPLPFATGRFGLVVSRHPTTVVWPEIARVLRPGATYFSQQVGAGSNRELTDFMMGPQPLSGRRSPARAVADAQAAGLEVVDLRHESLEVRFYDVGAVVYFLRKVPWTVPGFNVEAYQPRLRAMYEHIGRSGSFVSHAERFVIEARKAS